ncbi:MAG: hypothetical protein ACKO3F_06225, partial [Cyanobium sp.]
FGNRLPSSDPEAVHPVRFEVVNGAGTPVQLITPTGLVEGTGLSQSSNNPYDPFNGPTLGAPSSADYHWPATIPPQPSPTPWATTVWRATAPATSSTG